MNKHQDIFSVLENLFRSAESGNGIDYIYTVVRVTGILEGVPDPLIELRLKLEEDQSVESDAEIFSSYRSLIDIEEPFPLVANLLNCAGGERYNPFPFHHLATGQLPNIVKPTPLQVVRELLRIAEETENADIAHIINDAYPEDILEEYTRESCSNIADLRMAHQKCHLFLTSLLEVYFAERLKFRGTRTLYKLPGFEVMDLLVNEDYGLYGFSVYFSNGNSAVFTRHPESTECKNVILDVPINFWVGDRDELRDEWRVGEKRLYEVGLPGRYNEPGEWKPLIYPGKVDSLEQEARAFSQDPDVQGIFFYMLCTGHRVIEFVVRTTVEFPMENAKFGENFHLFKCPPLEEGSYVENMRIYDCYWLLDSTEPEDIRYALDAIGIGVNTMAFAYGAAADWRIKYSMREIRGGRLQPSKEDLDILNSLVRNFPRGKDASILDAAIDWYNHGNLSRNVFTGFLCYYIAIESVATAVADGKADLGLNYSKESRVERDQSSTECIQDKYESLYSEDPIRFVRESYFDCVISLNKKTRSVAELVFGPEHDFISMLFKKGDDGYSLSNIRARIAHGGITLISKEDENLILNRVVEIKNISKEFITRIVFRMKPSDPLPTWSQKSVLSVSFKNPRHYLVGNQESISRTKDWRIKPEWCI